MAVLGNYGHKDIVMRILILILCLVALVGCEQRTVDASVSQERHGLVYVPNETEPYTGNITKSYPSGQLEYEAALVDGKQNGLTREWHENGQLESEATYVDGEKNGLGRYWSENGQLLSEITYVDGRQNGLSRYWYVSGEFKCEDRYVDGILTGLPRDFHESDQRIVDRSLLQELDGLIYAPNQSEPFTGYVTEYYSSGQLRHEIEYVDGKLNGLSRGWYESGRYRFEQNHVNGKFHGLLRYWQNSGRLTEDKVYVDGEIVTDNYVRPTGT